MNQHLSSRSISKYLSGGGVEQVGEHLRSCEGCRAEVTRIESAVAEFRETVRNWAGESGAGGREMTLRPVLLKSIWGVYRPQKKSWALSLVLQSAAVAMLFAAASNSTVRQAARQVFELHVPVDIVHDSGGGGGRRSPLPASQGKLPKPSLRQFTPPEVVSTNPNPKLTVEPSIIAPPDVAFPQIASDSYGDPLGVLGLPSGGPGSGGGIGLGTSTGVGAGPGAGAWGSGAYRIGGAVSAPVLLYKVEPEYSEEARKAKYQGVVVLKVVVDPTGRVVNPQIVRSLGLGLDEKAIEAVRKWKFRPGYKDGKPVSVIAEIEVSFRLL